MSAPLSFGIIGTGKISSSFASAAVAAGCQIGAVYSRNFDTGAAFAAKNGIFRVFTSLPEMLASPDLDAIYVASPNFLHREHTLASLAAGKHVLCEKPIASSYAEAREMIDAAARAHRVLLEAMRPDFDPVFDTIREDLSRIAPLRRVSVEYDQYSSRYDAFRAGEVKNAFDPSLGNCALADIGIYPLHFAVRLFGLPRDLCARSVFLPGGFEGAGQLLLDYGDRGFTVTVSYSKISDSARPSVFEGEGGSLLIDRLNAPRRVVFQPRAGEPVVHCPPVPDNNMVYEITAFCEMVAGERDPAPYLAVSADTMRAYDLAVRSAGIFS